MSARLQPPAIAPEDEEKADAHYRDVEMLIKAAYLSAGGQEAETASRLLLATVLWYVGHGANLKQITESFRHGFKHVASMTDEAVEIVETIRAAMDARLAEAVAGRDYVLTNEPAPDGDS